MEDRRSIKPISWVGAAKGDFDGFPKSVQREMGFELYIVQIGRMPMSAKALRGFRGGSVLELRAHDERSNIYRTVYTVRFASAIYVLHAFQKKSKRGIATSKRDIGLIKARLKLAAEDHRERSKDDPLPPASRAFDKRLFGISLVMASFSVLDSTPRA